MSTQFAVAPQAPGSLGEDVGAPAILRYLDDLGRWRDRRRTELDQLDEASLRSPERDALTGDVLLSMALWKAVAERHDLLLETWDSGRVLEAERRRITTLIWGRLDQRAASGNALAVSLPEACRLSDTLAASLRSRLRLEGAEPDVSQRIRDLRAQVERIRDQVGLVPSAARSGAQQVLVTLDRRLVDVTDRARRGADVGGLLGPLELDLATAERDLIVAASTRDRARGEKERAARLTDELVARADAVRRLAARCAEQVAPAPRLGVPDPTALGDAPADPAALATHLAKLDRVSAALDQAHAAYAGALEERDDLAAQARTQSDQAGSVLADRAEAAADVADLTARIDATLAAVPVPLPRLRALVAAQRAYLAALGPSASTTGH